MKNLVNAVLISRSKREADVDPVQLLDAMIRQGHSLILFPEGTRGVPGVMADFKRGVGHLASRHPDVPVIPVYLDGLYRNLPKGRSIIVPLGGTLVMGDPMHFPEGTSVDDITEQTQAAIQGMAEELRQQNQLPDHGK